MKQIPGNEQDKKRSAMNLTLTAVAGSSGCLTLVIVLAALFLGLYLDRQFNTKPAFTIGLILGSIPVSLVVMFFVVRSAVNRIKPSIEEKKSVSQEGSDLGGD